jgi:hypothetical protein
MRPIVAAFVKQWEFRYGAAAGGAVPSALLPKTRSHTRYTESWDETAPRKRPKVRFAEDSPLEGDGFEASVPVEGAGFCCGRQIAGDRTGAAHKELFLLRGTDGSNPLPSSGESPANLSFRRIEVQGRSREADGDSRGGEIKAAPPFSSSLCTGHLTSGSPASRRRPRCQISVSARRRCGALRPDCRSGFSRNAENRLPGELNCLPRSITAEWRSTIDGCSTFWRISGDQHKRRRPNVIFGNGLRKLRFERK